MSSMLEQAIIDAKALREAAVNAAEQKIIEKYAPEVKEAVQTLLEQSEQDMMRPANVASRTGSCPNGATSRNRR